MTKIIKKSSVVTKTLIWNRCGGNGDSDDGISECELSFNDAPNIKYICDDIDELENEHIGIYELLEDGTYIQVEDWEN